jgi:hypothetical protein
VARDSSSAGGAVRISPRGDLVKLAGALLLLALCPTAALAAGPPVAIAPGAVDGDPDIDTRDFHGPIAWSMTWYSDAQGRALRIGFVEGVRLPYRDYRGEMLGFMHDQASEDEADLRRESDGRAEQIWGLEVFWLIASERAVMAPDPAKPETTKGNRLHRGDARRNCAVFTAYPPGKEATLIGSYCRELPPGATIDEAAARQWLEALDLKVAR